MTRKENYDELTVNGDPAATDTDLATKADQSEVDSLSTTVDTKADQDGGGTATLTNYDSIETATASIGGRAIYVQTEADLQPLRDGVAGTYIVAGAIDISSTLTLSEGQTLAGLGSSSKLQPTGDFPLVEIIPAGFDDHAHLTNLTLDIAGSGLTSYTSSAVRFTSEGRYESGPPEVSNLLINGGSVAGSGSAGIELYADSTLRASGISWVRVDGVRIYAFDNGIEQNTADSSAWINGNHFLNIDTTATSVGIYQDLSTGMQQNNNVYHLATNGSSSISKFFHIEGDKNWIISDCYDPQLNTYQWGWGTLEGNWNMIVTRVGGSWIGRRIENVGFGNAIDDTRWQEKEWMISPGYPTWIEPRDSAKASFERSGGLSAIHLESSGTAAGATAALEPSGASDIYWRWSFPWFEVPFRLGHETQLFAGVELYGGSGTRYGIYADPDNTLGTGIAANFIAYAENPTDGSQFSDTGIAIDMDPHYVTICMGREEWNLGISLDGTRYLRFPQTVDPPSGHPRIMIEQTADLNRSFRVLDRVRFSQSTEDAPAHFGTETDRN